MTTRRQIVLALSACALAPFTSLAQQPGKVWRIGFLSLRFGPSEQDEALRTGLRELGYVVGRDVTIEYRWAAGDMKRLPELAAELVRLKVDIIVTAAHPPTEALMRATHTIPIVMAASADPVGAGIVKSLARPGGNVTGLTLMSTDLGGKRLQLVRELLPKITRVAVLILPSTAGGPLLLAAMQPAAQQMGMKVLVQEAAGREDLPAAFAAMQRERAQALIVQVNPITFEHRMRVAELAAQHLLPTICEIRDQAEAGGLISYGPDLVAMYRRAATYVDKILKGAKPADLPIEQPTQFELVVNLKTAKTLRITIPRIILQRADRVIE